MNVRSLIRTFLNDVRALALMQALAQADAAVFAADADQLLAARSRARFQPRRVPVRSADWPLPGCETCEPWLPAWLTAPTLEPDFGNHVWPAARTTEATMHWMRCAWPEAWWDTDGATVANTADRLLMVRCRAALREIQP
jgi:hypothetical protein